MSTLREAEHEWLMEDAALTSEAARGFIQALRGEVERLTNKLNADSQNFQIECQKAEIEMLRADLAAARAEAPIWQDAVTDPPTRHGTYLTDVGLAQWVVWTRTWVGPCEDTQQTVLTPRLWTALPTAPEQEAT